MAGPKFSLEGVSRNQRQTLLDAFARELERYLASTEGVGGGRRRELMHALGKEVIGRPIDARQFDPFLRALYEDGVLGVRHRLLSEPSAALGRRRGFRDLQDITVVGGTDDVQFARAAARDLVQTMFRLAAARPRKKGQHLDIGIVSGSTIGSVIRAARELNWSDELGLDALDLPAVRVFPLNVSLASPDQVAGNAMILAFELAEKINAEVAARLESSGRSATARETRAEAFGLSAPLLARTGQLHEFDLLPQTFDVVRCTEPYRVRERLESPRSKRKIGETDTELDIIVTSVGELPVGTSHSAAADAMRPDDEVPRGRDGSTFYLLAEQFEFPMKEWIQQERIVGDIAYSAIRSDGTPVPLRKQSADDPSVEDEYLFYTAARLPVFERMAQDSDKAVILIARHAPDRYMIPALFASIAGERHRYASRLVTDEETAKQLLHY